MNKKIVIKDYTADGVTVSLQSKLENGTFSRASDVLLSADEIDGLSFREVLESICDGSVSEKNVSSFNFSPYLMKKNLIIIGIVLFVSFVLILWYAMRETKQSILSDIKSIRDDREKMYDSCLQSCMDKRAPYDNRVVERQLKLQKIGK